MQKVNYDYLLAVLDKAENGPIMKEKELQLLG